MEKYNNVVNKFDCWQYNMLHLHWYAKNITLFVFCFDVRIKKI